MADHNAKGRSKKPKRGPDEYFVQLYHTMLDEPAWKALKTGAQVLYLYVKRRYNGRNNGEIPFSVREAAEALPCSRSAAEKYVADLKDKGFIRAVQVGHLGVGGKGRATMWALTEVGLFGERPTKDYREWQPDEKQKPVPKLRTGCPEIKDTSGGRCPDNKDRCPEIEDRKPPKTTPPLSLNSGHSIHLQPQASAGEPLQAASEPACSDDIGDRALELQHSVRDHCQLDRALKAKPDLFERLAAEEQRVGERLASSQVKDALFKAASLM